MYPEYETPLGNLLDTSEIVRVLQRVLASTEPLLPAQLVQSLRRNKVPLLSLSQNGATSSDAAALIASQEFVAAMEDDRATFDEFHGEYVRLVQAWSQVGIPCICFKSAGIAPSFPYTSDNADILVPARRVEDARRVLLALGYVEMTNTEEHLKWLFRRFVGGRNVSLIHLHARVAWEEGFMLDDEIWNRCRQSPDDVWTMIPGAEDAVLINLAHAIIENKEISLHDLIKIRHSLADGSIDWEYMDRVAEERGWLDCLHFGLLCIAKLEEDLYGESTVPTEQRERFQHSIRSSWWLSRYWDATRRRSPVVPFAISFTVSKVLFFSKLWTDRHLATSEKPSHTMQAFRQGARQKFPLHMQNSMLISLSGVDGGGKSSHARAMRDAFETAHVRTRIAWTRIGDTPVLRILRGMRKRYEQRKGPVTSRAFNRRGWRLALWALIATADYATWLQHVRWRLLRGDVVIADRYLCDFDVELSTRLDHTPWLAHLLIEVLRLVAPTPKRAYLLRIEPEVSRRRKPESDFRDLDPADMQRRYDALAPEYGLIVYDASRPMEEVSTTLIRDSLTTYMAEFRQLLRAFFFSNPDQLNPRERPTQ